MLNRSGRYGSRLPHSSRIHRELQHPNWTMGVYLQFDGITNKTEYTMPSTSNTIASVTTTANSHESTEDNIKLSSHGTYEPLYNNLLITRKALCMTRLLQ